MANPHQPKSVESRAVNFAVAVIDRGATDWQEVQEALSNHPEFSAHLGDEMSAYQSVIRKAEAKFSGNLPTRYSD